MSVLDAAALLLSAAGLVAAVAGAAATGRPRSGVPMMLDLWVAAGLLRLGGEPAWDRVLVVAVLVVLRTLVPLALAPRARYG